jgi:LPS export ABC transporter permease LptF/LPS export ABC transporter permease LptG
MRQGGRLIERYIIGAILPFLLLSLLLLTAILFTQQASRFGEMLMGAQVPLGIVGELALSILPNVLVFTLPMALLTGILIGFSRMGSDSEIIAMRAAGVGTWQMLWPALLLGALLTIPSLYVNLEMAPDAARSLRRVGARALLYKLESPVEPRSFNTDIPGYVIYVREGDRARGQWGKVFLYTETKDGFAKLVTARSGRIDAAGEQSELVLNDVVLTTLPLGKAQEERASYTTERLEQMRIVLETGRKTLLKSLREEESEPKPVEMGWRDLSAYASSKGGVEGREATILLQKRLALSMSPLLFAFLGTALGMRVRRGGRGAGVLLSVLAMLAYYLLSLVGEQLARAGTIAPLPGAWLASALTVAGGLFLLAAGRGRLFPGINVFRLRRSGQPFQNLNRMTQGQGIRTRLLGFPGLLDVGVLRAMVVSFAVSFGALVSIFLVFTLFELWRFVISRGMGMRILGEYLLYLLPLVGVQLLPSCLLIATLATYALMSRRNEAIAWWASGQSVYRLMLPALIFALGVTACLWVVQERVMPHSNIKQDALRSQIKGGGARTTVGNDRQWLASMASGRLYSYEYENAEALSNVAVFDFDPEGVHLKRVTFGRSAHWLPGGGLGLREVLEVELREALVGWNRLAELKSGELEPPGLFKQTMDKASHLSAKSLSDYIKLVRARGGSTAALEVGLQAKYARPFGVLLMGLIAVPLAISFGRKSTVVALCVAIGLGLIFFAVSGGLQQLGEYGLLPPLVAAWAPVVIFSAVGMYLLSRTRT